VSVHGVLKFRARSALLGEREPFPRLTKSSTALNEFRSTARFAGSLVDLLVDPKRNARVTVSLGRGAALHTNARKRAYGGRARLHCVRGAPVIPELRVRSARFTASRGREGERERERERERLTREILSVANLPGVPLNDLGGSRHTKEMIFDSRARGISLSIPGESGTLYRAVSSCTRVARAFAPSAPFPPPLQRLYLGQYPRRSGIALLVLY